MKKQKKINKKHDFLSSRCAALEILSLWQEEKKPINQYVEKYIRQVDQKDQALMYQLINGILKQMEYLDVIISKFSKHPLGKMKVKTLMALRLGTYQLLLLDRIPESAAVNETVKALKAQKQPTWLIRFVNGVLRSIGRKRLSLPLPENAGENSSRILNHPKWLVSRWEKQYGQEKTGEICRINNEQAPLCLRVNTVLGSCLDLEALFIENGLKADRGIYAPESLVLHSYNGPVTGLPGYAEGLFFIQDEAAQLGAFLLSSFQGKRYLDACAGLGGKTCTMAQNIPSGAQLIAVEPDGRRFSLLGDNLRRLHLKNKVEIIQGSLEQYSNESPGQFDAILLDVPCSGTGVIRRQPDIRWNRAKEEVLLNQKIQLGLLNDASALLSVGGALVYSTCSLEPEENEVILDTFLQKHSGYAVENAKDFLPEKAAPLVDGDGFFHPTPADGIDGFFAALLKRIA